MTKKLTNKQQQFIFEYLKDLNATQAAIRAGYSKRTANRIGTENLSKPVIADAIRMEMQARQERTKVDADWLLTRLALEADADLADLFTEEGILKQVNEWPDIWRKGLVAGVDIYEDYSGSGDESQKVGQTVKIKVSDRVKRLDLIGKHIDVQAFNDRSTIDIGEKTLSLILGALPPDYAKAVREALMKKIRG